MERLLAGSSLKVRAPISESPAVKCERNLSVRRGLMQLAVPGRRTPVPLRCVRWDEGNTAQQGILTYQSEEFMNAVEVRQWECGKSLNYIAAKQGITIRRHYRLGHGSNGTETEKDAPRNILQHIIWDKEVEVAQYKQAIPLETLKKNIKNAPPARDFIGALRESYLRTGFPALIAEVKKASPSKGVLREDFDPVSYLLLLLLSPMLMNDEAFHQSNLTVEIAKVYEKNGAACLSILTDKKYFQGSFENLEDVRKSGVQCPLLCKEFVIDSWQIYYARSKGADAILLIAAVLPDVDIMYMTLVCRELGLTAIVEVHNEREMDRVLQIDGIQLIGINNRSLETFEVDISNTKKLLEGERRDLVRKKGIKCYQSGIRAGLSEGADANSQRRDQLALGQIHQGVDYSIFGLIANAKTAKEAWDTLKLSYKGVDRAQKSKLQSLRRLYDRCEMSSTETVEHYFSRLTDLVNKMRLYGDKIGDDAVVEKILRTIPLKYDHVVASIQESHDIELLTIAELKDCRYKKFNNHGNQANIAGNYGEDSNESETLLLAKKEKSIIVPDIPDDFLDEQPTQDNVQVSVQSEAPTRRSQRECRLPARLQDYVLSNDNDLSDEEIVVGESGLFVPQDISYVHDAGVRAVLVGESLIKQADPGKAISGLFGKDISK
ncbi:hypothetical protein ZIOFF_005696 [Zingiber officinale]|uniref:indole-3-glycerol-phosphate synthase n=1 Tax=Zingiber officinale TaxID=94328 RepID=A0A8J5I1P8_ZINOF|nr:hypothetical protein ZIOFF_005696 [Zingiber officinale]